GWRCGCAPRRRRRPASSSPRPPPRPARGRGSRVGGASPSGGGPGPGPHRAAGGAVSRAPLRWGATRSGPSPREGAQMQQPPLPGLDVGSSTVASPSALERYRHCPRLYRFLYVDGLWQYSRSSASQAFGTSVHAAMRDLFRLPPHRRSAEVLVRRFEASYAREGGGARDERARGAAGLRRWFARAGTTVVPFATEVALSATWGDVTLKGRLDRVDRTPEGL